MVKTEESSELIQSKLTKSELGLLLVLALVQFTHIIDFMIVMPLGAQFMTIFDITPKQFSWIVSSYSATAFLAGFLSALFIDRFDRKYALLVLYLGFILGTFACSQASSYGFFSTSSNVDRCIWRRSGCAYFIYRRRCHSILSTR